MEVRDKKGNSVWQDGSLTLQVGVARPERMLQGMCEEKIRMVAEQFAAEVKKIFWVSVQRIILYGSCARGDFGQDSDIDIMVLLDIPQDEIGKARKEILDISDCLDLDYDVVVAPVILDYQHFQKYMQISGFYQNVQKEGVRIA